MVWGGVRKRRPHLALATLILKKQKSNVNPKILNILTISSEMFYKALWMTDLLSPSPTFCTLVSLGPTSFLRGIIHFWYHQCAILVIKSWQLACLEVGWGFVFLASCSSLSQEKGIIPWTLLFPRCYVLTNSRINEEVTYMCPALQLHLGPPES